MDEEAPVRNVQRTNGPPEVSQRICEELRGGGEISDSVTKPQTLLAIAKTIQAFIDSNGWSWCDMERVYRILKVVNG